MRLPACGRRTPLLPPYRLTPRNGVFIFLYVRRLTTVVRDAANYRLNWKENPSLFFHTATDNASKFSRLIFVGVAWSVYNRYVVYVYYDANDYADLRLYFSVSIECT